MNQLQVYQWQGFDIQFEIFNGQVYANGTQMFQAAGSRLDNWKTSPQVTKYIDTISLKLGISENQLVISKSGSPQFGGGTWVHERLILNAARYISVEFEIQCDEWISELHRIGKVELQPASVNGIVVPDFANPAEAARAWADQYEARKAAELEAATNLALAQKNARKANYTDQVLQAENAWTTTSIAKELGMSAIGLNRKLKELGIQFFRDGHWLLTHRYQSKGYTKTRTTLYKDSQNRRKTAITTVWTETGRAFIHKQLSPSFNQEVKLIETGSNEH